MNDAVFHSVDCSHCQSLPACGGLPHAGFWGCYDHCLSKCDPATCDFTCPHNTEKYCQRLWEVGGLSSVRLERVPIAQSVAWPSYVPVVYGKYRRRGPAASPCVTLPLAGLFRSKGRSDIEPVAGSAEELRDRFKLRPDARILASGVGPDDDIEWLWHFHKTAPLGEWLRNMGVSLATAPNYSYFAYAPRDHYLWNRKRMLLFVQRLGEQGFEVIPHLYGETLFDWKWWARYFFDHPHLHAFAVELQTSDALKDHLPEFLDRLRLFRAHVGRSLTAYVMGGRRAAAELAAIFEDLVVVEASSYMRTVHRRLAVTSATGDIYWRKIRTNGDLDAVFDHNTRVIGDGIISQIAAGRARTGRTQTFAA